ncbi:RIP metalloprotease RseP [Halobacteriovorax sp. ZH4_bin.1]|uniref:RIP metalloprotease RseP n=1 Tax=unclassified Halobacteriovorax TaxID=2639665 RepID=UPI00371159A4
MLEKIVIFILFLGPLVFFHELGHFLFARLFGVRVEVFSIGFGPKLFRWKKGDTEYAISLIPLGGYVKMFGDDPFNKDGISEEEKKFSFIHKKKWQRFWIVFGGPLANFILAFFIFFALFLTGEKVPEIKIGNVAKETRFYKLGFRSGDIVNKVNEHLVTSPSDIVLESDGHISSLTVERLGRKEVVKVDMKPEQFFEEMVKYPPFLLLPIVKSADGNLFIVSKGSKPNTDYSLEELAIEAGHLDLFPVKSIDTETSQPIFDKEAKAVAHLDVTNGLKHALFTNNYFPMDLVVKSVQMKSPADKAGLLAGDIITSVNEKEVNSFDELRGEIQENEGQASLKVIRKGETKEFNITPDVRTESGKTVKLIGVYSHGIYAAGKYVTTEPMNFFKAIPRSLYRTWDGVVKTFEGFKKLITAEVSLKNIGGPLTIGKVASDSFNTSISYFFQLMALISINLGVINLFPIPVLDGGHIVFLILEAINGGPLSRRKLEIAQQFGLSILLLLMIGALFNDFTRFF